MPPQNDDRILIDFRTSDDAGVYRWEGRGALVQTVDFFTPIVDDPYVYGQIAAANALSDIYAMGGRPLTALAVAGFPRKGIDRDTMRQVFRGGFDKLREADVALLGGHTVQDSEIKFGYAVTGEVDPSRMLSNAGARAGDLLYLTKPIGIGVIATAIKFGRAPTEAVEAAIRAMCALNREAAQAISVLPAGSVHACTDITGFGLIGHASEMAAASGVTVRLRMADIPLLPHARALAEKNRSGGMNTNQQHFAARVGIVTDPAPDILHLLFDPQTSGGLLMAVDPAHALQLEDALARAGVLGAAVGSVEDRASVEVRLA